MSFLLDTCTLSELTRPNPDEQVRTWFGEQESTALYLSVLTVGEIEKGIALLRPSAKKRGLIRWLSILRSDYADRILNIDPAIAVTWGQLSARAQSGGRSLSVVDGLIAATALHHGFTVVTRNAADFRPSGVAVLNPWQR